MFVLTSLLLHAGCTSPEERKRLDAEKERALQTLKALRADAQSSVGMMVRCEPGTRPGSAGVTDDETTAKGILYNVRTPDDYDPQIAYPLLMVYAPAGMSATGSEKFTGLTPYATAAGFVVAYARHRRMSIPTIMELSTIPSLIAKKWCINEKRVYPTGHSDGGTVALALAILEQTRQLPAAIAPSAAGMRGSDLTQYACPAPLPVMMMHGARDRHFPGFGSEVAAWWAACNKCDPTPGPPMENGCIAYPRCTDDVTTWYCEGNGSHATWPALNTAIVKFFSAVSNVRK
ncbi:MAG: alpha/beta hydrolase family esterase [Candidatus Binatia bacterium]